MRPARSAAVETRTSTCRSRCRLDCGRELHPVRVAYETYGTLSPAARQRDPGLPRAQRRRARRRLLEDGGRGRAPATGSAPRTATARPARALGWWDGMIGPGKAFDTDHYFVVSTNLLGGCRGTTGPSSIDPATGRPYGPDFPVITVADMVRDRARVPRRARHRAARRGGRRLARRDAGAGVGGPVSRTRSTPIVAIASTHALHPQGLAWNAIAREAIMRDPAWQGGHYYGTGRAPDAGMGVARMVGHITYLSAAALERQVRPAAAVRRRHPLHDHRAGVRGRELPAPPGRLVRQALRRQHLPLHVARADLLRPRPPARRRVAHPRAGGRSGAHAADRVQLRLALPAGRVARRSRRRCARSASRSSCT